MMDWTCETEESGGFNFIACFGAGQSKADREFFWIFEETRQLQHDPRWSS